MPEAETVPVVGANGKGEARLQLARLTQILRKSVGALAPRPSQVRPVVLEALFRQEPLLKRGIQKHAGDAVKHWFHLTKPGSTEPHARDAEFQAWARRIQLKPKVREALVSAHVYGDGFLEFEWDDGGASTTEARAGAQVVDVHLIDAVDVQLEKVVTESRVRGVVKRDVRFDLLSRPLAATIRLHPDRYDHRRLNTLPGFVHGLSTVECAYNIALSKVKGDQGIGEVLFYAGVPFRTFLVANAQAGDLETIAKLVTDPAFQRGLVWDDRLKVEQHNPVGIDPDPYYQVMLSSTAAAIGIPKMLLEGAQAGAVEGSETNLEDYHSDLREVEENTLTPLVERLALGRLGLDEDAYDVAWNPFPVRAKDDALLLQSKASSFNFLVTGGVTPAAAARVLKLDLKPEDFAGAPEPQEGLLPASAATRATTLAASKPPRRNRAGRDPPRD